MAKKLGKLLLGLTAVGTAAAGAYYLLKKKDQNDFDEDFEDDFDEDFELDDDLGEVTSERGYVSLNPSGDSKTEEASDTPEDAKAEEAAEETKEEEAAADAEEKAE